jgi:hypothetical protein
MPFILTVPGGVTATPESESSILLAWEESLVLNSPMVNIGAADIFEWHGTEIPTKARLYASKTFTATDQSIVLGGHEAVPDAFQEFDLTLTGTTVRIEAGNAYVTTDSDHPEVTYNLDGYDAFGNKLFPIYSKLRIPPDLDPTTWQAIKTYSAGRHISGPTTYLTADETLALIQQVPQTGANASSIVHGVSRLDVDPANLTDPIAVGANSPKISKDLLLDYGNSFLTAVSLIGSNNVRLAVTAPVTESSDRSLPVNIQLDVKPGGLITIASGKTFTVNSLLDPGNRQIFAGTGNFRLARGSVNKFNTTWWSGPVSGANIDKALTDIFASCAANHGGHVFIPDGQWLCSGNQNISIATTIEGASRHGYSAYGTEIKLTTATRPLFNIPPGNWNTRFVSLTLNGNSLANTQGILTTGTAGVDPIASGIFVESCAIMSFTDGIYLHGVSDWQIRQVHIDRSCLFDGNSQSGVRISTINSNVRCDADFNVLPGGAGIWVEKVGGLVVQGSEFGGFGGGTQQVMKQTVAGSVTVAGLAKSVITKAGLPGSPITVNVPVTTADSTPGAIANTFRREMSKDANVAAYFHVLGENNTGEVYLACVDQAANDGTFNFTIDTGTATGITNSPTATTDYAGVAPTAGENDTSCIKITGPYLFISVRNTQDEGIWYTVKHDFANGINGILTINGSLVQGRIAMIQQGSLGLIGVTGAPKYLRDAPAGSSSSVNAVNCSTGAFAFIGSGIRTCEQRIHNFSDIVGIGASWIDETTSHRAFDWPDSHHNSRTFFSQPAGVWFGDPAEAWVHILGKFADQRLLRLGRAGTSGYADAYYDFWRDSATGKLRIDGSQPDPFKGLLLNCPLEVPDAAYDATLWDASVQVPTKNAVRDQIVLLAPKASPVFTGRVRNSTSTVITPGATPSLDASLGDIFTLTPGEDETIAVTNQAAGQEIVLVIHTSGTTSRTITFGSGFKPSGTLATGTVDSKYFVLKFFSDGTNAYELTRTAAL